MKQFLILILIVGFLTPSLACADSPDPTDGYSPNSAVDFILDPQDRWTLIYPEISAGSVIYIDIVVTSGSTIDVLVLNTENMLAHSTSDYCAPVAGFLNHDRVSASVVIPTTEAWYIIIDNPDSSSSSHVQGNIGTSLFEMPSFVNTTVTFTLITIIGISVVIFLKIRKTQKNKNQQPAVSPPEMSLGYFVQLR